MGNLDARTRLAKAMQAYLEQSIDNDDLFAILWSDLVCQDDTCWEIAHRMDLFLDEFNGHRNAGKYRIGKEGEQVVRRWIALLRTNWQWPTGRSDSTPRNTRSAIRALWRGLVAGKKVHQSENCNWPLTSEEEWKTLLGEKEVNEMALE
jgi:hypothetical protein